jgi:hypothetical protein
VSEPDEAQVYPLPSNGWRVGDGTRLGRNGGPLHMKVENGRARAWLGRTGESLVLWPEGWGVRIGGAATAELIAPDGSVFAREGDLMQGAGGILSDKLARERFGLGADDPLLRRRGWSLTEPERVESFR